MIDWPLLGLILFACLNLIDFRLTRYILAHGGRELNPILRSLYRRFGMRGIACIKWIIICSFTAQYSVNKLDLYTIYYLNFVFTFIICFMVYDCCKAGILNVHHLNRIVNGSIKS